MKYFIFCIFIAVLFPSFLIAQLFSRAESVKIYGLVIKASEVGTGTNKFSGTGESFYGTKDLLDVVKASGNYLTDMGTYRINYQNYKEGTHPLFNLSYDRNNFPLLDTIDMDFYRTDGIPKLLRRNPKLKNDPTFNELKSAIIDSLSWSTKQKKDFLFKSDYDSIREQLIETRIDTSANHTFTIDKKKVSVSTIKLKATLDTIVINNGISGKAGLFAYIHNLADENVKVLGKYYNPQFDANYIAKIQYFLQTIDTYNTRLDQFAYWLKIYINSDFAAANTELVGIQLTGTYDKTKVNADSISLDLSTKFEIPKVQADKIAVSLTFAFSKNETTTVSSNFNAVYILRYYTSKSIDELVFKPLKTDNKLISKFIE
jgi:hypothetical protein